MKWIGLIVALLLSPVLARDPDGRYANSQFHQWFESQTNSRGGSCCADADGHEYDGDYTMNEDGSVTLGLPNGPYRVEAYKVLKDSRNPTGHAIWWFVEGYNGNKTTFCFAPGPLT